MSLPPDDQVAIGRLLAELVNRIHGVVDFWTIVCVSEDLSNRLAFLGWQAERLKALAVAVEILLKNQADQEPQCGLLKTIQQGCDRLHAIFLVLVRFREESLENLRAATEQLKQTYHEVLPAIQALRQSLGCPVPSLEEQRPGQKEYYERILDGFLNMLLAARTPNQAVVG